MSLISTDLRPVGYDWVLYSRYTELYRNYTAVWKRFRILITENSFFRKQSFLGHWNWSVYVSRPVDVRLGVISGRNDFQILTSENCVLRKLIFFPNFDLYTRYRADAKYFPNKYFQKSIVLAVESSSEAWLTWVPGHPRIDLRCKDT